MTLFELKRKWRYLFQITFSDTESIIFRILPLKEVSAYKELAIAFPHLNTLIEDEIFKNCVLDSTWPIKVDEEGRIDMKNLDIPAGVVTSVANAVVTLSEPPTEEDYLQSIIQAKESLTHKELFISSIESVLKCPRDMIEGMYWMDAVNLLVSAEQTPSGGIVNVLQRISEMTSNQNEPDPNMPKKIEDDKFYLD